MLLRSWVWSSAGVAHHGVGSPQDAAPVFTLACSASSVLDGLRVVCLQSARWLYSSVVGVWQCQPPYGPLVCRWACRAAADVAMVV